MPEVYSEPYVKHHYASRFSTAYCFKSTAYVFIFALTIVIAVSTESLWLKVSSYYEQPRVTFTHDVLLLLEGGSPGKEHVWSTFPALNTALANRLASVDIQATDMDVDHDGKTDILDVSVRAAGVGPVHSLKMLLTFRYELQNRVKLRMQSLAYICHSSGLSGASLSVDGELQLRQRNPLDYDHVRLAYDEPALAPGGPQGQLRDISTIELSAILRNYLSRNETTEFVCTYPVWQAGNGPGFSAHVRVRIPTSQKVEYVPGILEAAKFAWMQVLSIYIVLWYLLWHVLRVTYHYRILGTRVVSDITKVKPHHF